MKKATHVVAWFSFGLVLANAQASCKTCKVNVQERFILQGNALVSHLVTSQSHCEMKCRENSGCFSINYYEEQKKCHLNKATHLSRPLHLVYDMGGVYIKIKNDYCSDGYCSTGHVCLIDDDKEDYSCQACNATALGMESKTIPNYRIVASSFLSNGHAPWRGRLNERPQIPYDASIDAAVWQANNRKAGEYLQVDLGSIYQVTKVATQGRPHMHSAWVSSYSLSYAVTNGNFIDYKVHGALKVFPGNFDRDTIVTNKLPVPVRFRYIRFVVVSYSDIPAMRTEIYGC